MLGQINRKLPFCQSVKIPNLETWLLSNTKNHGKKIQLARLTFTGVINQRSIKFHACLPAKLIKKAWASRTPYPHVFSPILKPWNSTETKRNYISTRTGLDSWTHAQKTGCSDKFKITLSSDKRSDEHLHQQLSRGCCRAVPESLTTENMAP